jgi:hypothetical protein
MQFNLLSRLKPSALDKLNDQPDDEYKESLISILESNQYFIDVPFGDVQFICRILDYPVQNFPQLFLPL